MAFKIIGNVDANRDLMYLDWNKQKVSHLQEQLSTGLRLVRASDNTNDLYIADQAKEIQTGLNKGISNLKQALAAVRESEEAASKIYDLLVKVKETLAEIADVADEDTRKNALETIRGYLAQIVNIVETTRYGDSADTDTADTAVEGVGDELDDEAVNYNSNILGKAGHILNFGGNSFQDIYIGHANITASGLTGGTQVAFIITKSIGTYYYNKWNAANGDDAVPIKYIVSLGTTTKYTIKTATQKDVETSLQNVEKALRAVRKLQTFLGQTEEMLQNLVENQQYKMDQMHEVESQLRDVDYAKAFAEMNKMNVVLQANVAALAQNNQINQLVTQLMR